VQRAQIELVDAKSRRNVVSLFEGDKAWQNIPWWHFEIDVDEAYEVPIRGTNSVRYGAAAPDIIDVLEVAECTLWVITQESINHATCLVAACIVDEDDLAGPSDGIQHVEYLFDAALKDTFFVVAREDER
jgi:hypothetical protein